MTNRFSQNCFSLFHIAAMKLAIATLLVGSAAAFAPATRNARSSVAVHASYENELGVIAPTGFFDPLGLSANIDQETFDAYRVSELKVSSPSVLFRVFSLWIPENFCRCIT